MSGGLFTSIIRQKTLMCVSLRLDERLLKRKEKGDMKDDAAGLSVDESVFFLILLNLT